MAIEILKITVKSSNFKTFLAKGGNFSWGTTKCMAWDYQGLWKGLRTTEESTKNKPKDKL